MKTIKVQLEFANPTVKAINHIHNIREASKYAGLNLYARYDIQLQYPMPTSDDRVVVEVKVPDEDLDDFVQSLGRRLRGISKYLLDNYGNTYRPIQVGNRLLNYIHIGDDNTYLPVTIDRIELIVKFATLLQRSDIDALDQIKRISIILEE